MIVLREFVKHCLANFSYFPLYYTGRALRGPGLCRRIVTSRVNCWDDDEVRSIDIPEFDGDDIEDQGMYNS